MLLSSRASQALARITVQSRSTLLQQPRSISISTCHRLTHPSTARVHQLRAVSSNSSASITEVEAKSSAASTPAPAPDQSSIPPLRVFLLPLARKTPSWPHTGDGQKTVEEKKNETMVYWHVSQQLPRPKKKKKKASLEHKQTSSSSSNGSSATTTSESNATTTGPLAGLDLSNPSSWPSFALDKATSIWLSWGETPPDPKKGEKRSRTKEGQYWIWTHGERLMDRIEYEE